MQIRNLKSHSTPRERKEMRAEQNAERDSNSLSRAAREGARLSLRPRCQMAPTNRVKTIQSQRGIGSDKERREGREGEGRGQTNKPAAVRVSRILLFARCPALLVLYLSLLRSPTAIWRRSVPKVVFCNGFTIIACRRQTSATRSLSLAVARSKKSVVAKMLRPPFCGNPHFKERRRQS